MTLANQIILQKTRQGKKWMKVEVLSINRQQRMSWYGTEYSTLDKEIGEKKIENANRKKRMTQ